MALYNEQGVSARNRAGQEAHEGCRPHLRRRLAAGELEDEADLAQYITICTVYHYISQLAQYIARKCSFVTVYQYPPLIN